MTTLTTLTAVWSSEAHFHAPDCSDIRKEQKRDANGAALEAFTAEPTEDAFIKAATLAAFGEEEYDEGNIVSIDFAPCCKRVFDAANNDDANDAEAEAEADRWVNVQFVAKMRVNIDAWNREYGEDEGANRVREALKSVIVTAINTPGVVTPADVDDIEDILQVISWK